MDKNLIGNTARRHVGYATTLQNLGAEPARVTVVDQVPVSEHPDLKVKPHDLTPRPVSQDEQGQLEWDLNLKPQEKVELGVQFDVEYPKDRRVTGLE